MLVKSLLLAAPVVAALAVAGCGGSDGTAATDSPAESSPAGTAAMPGAATTTMPSSTMMGRRNVMIRMSEFAFAPSAAAVRAGKVSITATNRGQETHELVLLKTDADPAKLPKKGGKVDESTSVGELADVAPGAMKRASFRLEPGRYVMVCALPGHYESGMAGTLTVR